MSTSSPKVSKNFIVVSDLHLGHTLRTHDDEQARDTLNFSQLRSVAALDRVVEEFLDDIFERFSHEIADTTLVLNGDIFDFLHVDLRPKTGTFEHPPMDGSREKDFGLSFELSRAVWKLDLIAKVHRRAFSAFARFVHRGGHLVFVAGNHDAELCFERIQGDLIQLILKSVPGTCDDIAQRISVESWFFLLQPYLYLEHGHRFDPYTTFVDPLDPTPFGSPDELAPNFAHYGLRYFANRVPSFPLYDLDEKPWVKIFQWVKAHTFRESCTALFAAFHFFFQYWTAMVKDRANKQAKQTSYRDLRRRRLAQIATRHGWSLNRVLHLDALRTMPVGATGLRLFQALQLDRIILVIFALVFWTAMAFSAHSKRGSAMVLFGLFIVALWRWLDRSRPRVQLHPHLGTIASQIGRFARVPLVIFGHTHTPCCESHHRVIWLNPGSWEHLSSLKRGANKMPVHFGLVSIRDDGLSAALMSYHPKTRKMALKRVRKATFRV